MNFLLSWRIALPRDSAARPRCGQFHVRVDFSKMNSFFNRLPDGRFPPARQDDDLAAEKQEGDPDEILAFQNQIASGSFEVPDSTTTVKTRGSTQKAFAHAVKSN